LPTTTDVFAHPSLVLRRRENGFEGGFSIGELVSLEERTVLVVSGEAGEADVQERRKQRRKSTKTVRKRRKRYLSSLALTGGASLRANGRRAEPPPPTRTAPFQDEETTAQRFSLFLISLVDDVLSEVEASVSFRTRKGTLQG
jgi:hypothetical protein